MALTRDQQAQIFKQGKQLHPKDTTALEFLEKGMGAGDFEGEGVRASQNRDFVNIPVNIDPNTVRGKQASDFFKMNLPNPESNAGRQAEDFIGREPLNNGNEQAQVFLNRMSGRS